MAPAPAPETPLALALALKAAAVAAEAPPGRSASPASSACSCNSERTMGQTVSASRLGQPAVALTRRSGTPAVYHRRDAQLHSHQAPNSDADIRTHAYKACTATSPATTPARPPRPALFLVAVVWKRALAYNLNTPVLKIIDTPCTCVLPFYHKSRAARLHECRRVEDSPQSPPQCASRNKKYTSVVPVE